MTAPPKSSPPAAATLDVTILGREFKIACAEGERAELKEAVAYLDRQMRDIRDRGKVTGVDRIAVMAALNITNELLRERKVPPPPSSVASESPDTSAVQRRIQSMQAAIDQALAGQEKLF